MAFRTRYSVGGRSYGLAKTCRYLTAKEPQLVVCTGPQSGGRRLTFEEIACASLDSAHLIEQGTPDRLAVQHQKVIDATIRYCSIVVDVDGSRAVDHGQR